MMVRLCSAASGSLLGHRTRVIRGIAWQIAVSNPVPPIRTVDPGRHLSNWNCHRVCLKSHRADQQRGIY
jgi:hypothetical protein